MLSDLLSRAVVMDGSVKLTQVQNVLDRRRVALQPYRHTWVRVTIALLCPAEPVARNPDPFVRPQI